MFEGSPRSQQGESQFKSISVQSATGLLPGEALAKQTHWVGGGEVLWVNCGRGMLLLPWLHLKALSIKLQRQKEGASHLWRPWRLQRSQASSFICSDSVPVRRGHVCSLQRIMTEPNEWATQGTQCTLPVCPSLSDSPCSPISILSRASEFLIRRKVETQLYFLWPGDEFILPLD